MNLGFSMVMTQFGLTFTALAGFAFAPPAQGRMLLLPVTSAGAAAIPAAAFDGGARLLGEGPVHGSLVVIGDRSQLSKATLARGIMVISAPAILCGSAGKTGEDI